MRGSSAKIEPADGRSSRFRDLARVVEQTQATEKNRPPLLSFARYGNLRSDKHSLRHKGRPKDRADKPRRR